MKNIHLLCLVCLVTLSSVNVLAQDITVGSLEEVRSQLDTMFSALEKNRIPTGYLLDYSVNLVEFDNYSGSLSDSNYVDSQVFADLLYSINSASVGDSLSYHAFLNTLYSDQSKSSLKAGVALFKYNYIGEDALIDGLISFSSGRVYDTYSNGIWNNPYEDDYLFGFTTNTLGYVWSNCQIIFPSSLIMTNVSITSLEFDAGDGLGYRAVQAGTPISVFYGSEGVKELKLKATLSGGKTLYSHTSIVAVEYRVGPQGTSGEIVPDRVDIIDAVHGGTTVSAVVSCFYGESRTGIEKPFIVSEGFDPRDLLMLAGVDTTMSGSTNPVNFYNKVPYTVKDYDIIYVDWINYKADIRANAALLEKIIEDINEEKHDNGSDELNVVYAESMGGLIACYALRSMELAGKDHETEYFIANDTPFHGANVPLGAQYLVREYLSIVGSFSRNMPEGFNQIVSLFRDLADAVSVRQLLCLTVNSGFLPIDGHSSLESEMAAMGFPKGSRNNSIENIAIIDGGLFSMSTTTIPQYSLFTPGSYLIKAHFKLEASGRINGFINGLAGYALIRPSLNPLFGLIAAMSIGSIPRKAQIELDVYPFLSSSQLITHFKISYEKRFLWALHKIKNLVNHNYYAPSSGLALDGLVGSYYNVKDAVDTSYAEFFMETDATNWANIDMGVVSKFSFVPTASALCSADYVRDYYTYPAVPLVETPFSSFIVPDTSHVHIGLYGEAKEFLTNILSYKVNGPIIIESGDTFSYSGFTDNDVSLSWSSSSPGKASINSSGVVSVTDTTGVVDIVCSGNAFGKTYRKAKTVFLGVPELVLSSSYSQGAYTVSVGAVADSLNTAVMRAVASGEFLCKWGVKINNGSISWSSPNRENKITVTPSSNDDLVTVFFKLVYNGTEESQALSIVAQKPDAFLYNIQAVGYDSQGTPYYYFNFFDIPNFDNSGKVRLILKANPASDNTREPYKFRTASMSMMARVSFSSTITVSGVKYYIIDITNYESIETYAFLLSIGLNGHNPLSIYIYSSSDDVLQHIYIPFDTVMNLGPMPYPQQPNL